MRSITFRNLNDKYWLFCFYKTWIDWFNIILIDYKKKAPF